MFLENQTLFAFGLGAILQASGLLNFSIGVLTGIVVCKYSLSRLDPKGGYYSNLDTTMTQIAETPPSSSFSLPSFFLSYFSSKK
jgi:hypothetical protein